MLMTMVIMAISMVMIDNNYVDDKIDHGESKVKVMVVVKVLIVMEVMIMMMMVVVVVAQVCVKTRKTHPAECLPH